MLYLVTGTIEINKYESERTDSKEVTRLVEADTERDAELKFENHYRGKTREYEIYYSCYNAEATSVIV